MPDLERAPFSQRAGPLTRILQLHNLCLFQQKFHKLLVLLSIECLLDKKELALCFPSERMNHTIKKLDQKYTI